MQWARYFDERVETMPPTWTRRLEDERLGEQVSRCYEQSAFYRRKLDGARVRPEQVRKAEDLSRMPLTTRAELEEEVGNDAPFGGLLCVELIDVVRVQVASDGPLAVGYTQKDARASAEVGARSFWAAGARPDDVVLHCSRFGLAADGVAAQAALEETGAAVVPVGADDITGALARWAGLQPTALAAPTTVALELADAAGEQGLDAHKLGLAKLLVRVEPEHRVEPAQRLLAEVWGVRTGAFYGVPEISCAFAAECEERDGLHFLGHGSVLAELVEPRTARPVPLEPGARGELVLTHLEREATPLLRFRTGDLVSIVHTECACGRTGFRFRPVGRV